MNRIRKLFTAMIVATCAIAAAPAQVHASGGKVNSVNSQVTNGVVKSTTVTAEAKTYNSTSPIVVTSMTDFKNRIEASLKRKDAALSLRYTGGSISDWKTAISSALTDVMNKPGNDYEKFTMKQWSYRYDSLGNVDFTFGYIETAQQSAYVNQRVSEITRTIIVPGMTEDQKEKAVNDYIVSHVSYDTSLVQHSAYAALVAPNKTVCQGYALLAYKMLTAAGLQARIIEGSAGGPHAWNLVRVNGRWYHLDTTWNDPVPDVRGRVRYDYFNLQDSQISDAIRKHTWDKTKYKGYEATAAYSTSDPDILRKFRMIVSSAPAAGKITITNNAGTADIIRVSGLKPEDVLEVFQDGSSSAKVMASAVVKPGTSEVSISVPQIGTKAGTLYFAVLSPGAAESGRVSKVFAGEPSSAKPGSTTSSTPSAKPAATTVPPAAKPAATTAPAAAKPSTVSSVAPARSTGLKVGDTVNVYSVSGSSKTFLGTAKVVATSMVAIGRTKAMAVVLQMGKVLQWFIISVV